MHARVNVAHILALQHAELLFYLALDGYSGYDGLAGMVQTLKQEVLQLQSALPRAKRSRTGYQPVSTLPIQDCDEVKLWDTQVRDAQVQVLLWF